MVVTAGNVMIPSGVYNSLFKGQWRANSAQQQILKEHPAAVTEEGIDALAFAEYFVRRERLKCKSGPSARLMEIRENLGQSPSAQRILDEEIAKQFAGVYVKGNDGNYAVVAPEKGGGTLKALQGRASYTAKELLAHKVITPKELREHRKELHGLTSEEQPMPRMWWALALATKINSVEGLAKLGFAEGAQRKLSLSSLEKILSNQEVQPAYLQLSGKEKEIVAVLENAEAGLRPYFENGRRLGYSSNIKAVPAVAVETAVGKPAGLKDVVADFYIRGKPFMEHPLMTLLMVTGELVEGCRSISDKRGAAPETFAAYVERSKRSLDGCLEMWVGNAKALFAAGEPMPTTGFKATAQFLGDWLKPPIYT